MLPRRLDDHLISAHTGATTIMKGCCGMTQRIEDAFFACAHAHALESALHHPAFPLPGDQAHYAPDRSIDITHLRLEIQVDFEQQAIHGVATLDARVIAIEVTLLELDADELHIERVSLVEPWLVKRGLCNILRGDLDSACRRRRRVPLRALRKGQALS